MIEYRCKSCGGAQQADDRQAGNTSTCEICKASLEIPFPPLELPLEMTSGGSVVYRHEPGTREWSPAAGNDGNIELISRHIEHQLGPVDHVFHELVSDMVHIDIHSVPPTEDRPFRTLITSGMSDRIMSAPKGTEECGYLELMLCLPPEWPVTQEALTDEGNYWPVRWLKTLARFPHEYNTWLFYGHSVPNGDPAEPFAKNTRFTGWLLMPPRLTPDSFQELEVDDEKTIYFAAILPVFDEEMEFKLENGTEALFERMVRDGVSELLDLDRPNVALSDNGPLD